MRYEAIGAAAVAAAGLFGAGCGGSSHRALPVAPITERDFAIRVQHVVPAGEVRLVLTNKGPVSQELLVVHARTTGCRLEYCSRCRVLPLRPVPALVRKQLQQEQSLIHDLVATGNDFSPAGRRRSCRPPMSAPAPAVSA